MKKVLITGGNSGLGFEVAKILIAKSYKVLILGKDKNKLEQAKNKINSLNLSTITCDLRDPRNVHELESKIKDTEILINCVGIIAYKPLNEHENENIKDIIETNLLGLIYITKIVLTYMKKRNSGTILNVSSTSGLVTGGHANESVYVASKFGVSGFTEALKKEIDQEKKNIRLLGFYPGGMRTELFSKAGLNKDTSSFMEPKEIAEIVVFMIERPESIKMDHVVVNRNKNTR